MLRYSHESGDNFVLLMIVLGSRDLGFINVLFVNNFSFPYFFFLLFLIFDPNLSYISPTISFDPIPFMIIMKWVSDEI
jgi:hypothetical protein